MAPPPARSSSTLAPTTPQSPDPSPHSGEPVGSGPGGTLSGLAQDLDGAKRDLESRLHAARLRSLSPTDADEHPSRLAEQLVDVGAATLALEILRALAIEVAGEDEISDVARLVLEPMRDAARERRLRERAERNYAAADALADVLEARLADADRAIAEHDAELVQVRAERDAEVGAAQDEVLAIYQVAAVAMGLQPGYLTSARGRLARLIELTGERDATPEHVQARERVRQAFDSSAHWDRAWAIGSAQVATAKLAAMTAERDKALALRDEAIAIAIEAEQRTKGTP